MANIFNEVDEDIRKERYQNLWSKYGKYVIGFLILIVIIFSLSQYLQSKNISDNKKILDIYFTAVEAIEKNQLDSANQGLETVYNDKNKVLSAISGIKLSQTYLKNNQRDKALSILENIYNNKSLEPVYRELALYKYIVINFENIEVDSIEKVSFSKKTPDEDWVIEKVLAGECMGSFVSHCLSLLWDCHCRYQCPHMSRFNFCCVSRYFRFLAPSIFPLK